MDTKIDLRGRISLDDLSVRDDPEEATHRRSQEVEDGNLRRSIEADNARHERHRENFRLVLLAAMICALVIVFYRVMASSASSADDRRWAGTALASVVSAALGYLVGKPTPHRM